MSNIIANRYHIQEELGAGGMGTVYKGYDSQTGQTIAIKQLKSEITDPETIARFNREGEALRDLNHPNIVKMLDTVEENNQHYLIIEYLSGGDLHDLLKKEQLSIERCLQLAIEIADALTRAHHLNIIHRDLKPANILIADDGTPRLTDFGIAHIVKQERITDVNEIMGTIDYLAPETFNDTAIDQRVDIWAFGITLFEMLAGQVPFQGDIIAQKVLAITTQPPSDLEVLRPDAPIDVIDIVYRMLEKDRNARIISMRHVGAMLEDILHGRSVQTPPKTRFSPPIPEKLHLPKNNLPPQITEFVGREVEQSELANLLDDSQIRLVTIVASGGMGKTRLAIKMASQYIEDESETTLILSLKDGAYFIELAPLSDPVNIVSAIGDAIGYKFQSDGRDQKQQIFDYLENKHMLLVMDNFEHLLDGANLVTEILKSAPHVKILATSRQRLNQTVETVFNLDGLGFATPETPQDALEYAAIKLFLQSARRVNPHFELTNDNLDDVVRVCKLVQGMPLGILLAASWSSMLSVSEIADEITAGNAFLESDMSDLPERHRSVNAVFDYSWNLMSEDERAVFINLAVFRGGFTRSAAQGVAGANLRILMNLMNKSLIRRDTITGRYSIHELLRQYGISRLKQANEYEEAHHKLAGYFTMFLNNTISTRPSEKIWSQFDPDFENIRTSWKWMVTQKQYPGLNAILPNLYRYCYYRGRWQESIELYELVWTHEYASNDISSHDLKLLLANLSEKLGFIYFMMGNWEQSEAYLQQGIHLAEDTQSLSLLSEITRHLATCNRYQSKFSLAKQYYDRSYQAAHEVQNISLMTRALLGIGSIYRHQHQYDEARSIYAQCRELNHNNPNKFEILFAGFNEGLVDYVTGDYQSAQEKIQTVLNHDRNIEDSWGTANDLVFMSLIACQQMELAQSRVYISEAIHLAYETHSSPLMLKIIVAIAQLNYAEKDFSESAQLLGLVMSHPSYQAEVAEIADLLHQQVSAQLGENFGYQFNQGKSLKLEAVMQALLEVFGET